MGKIKKLWLLILTCVVSLLLGVALVISSYAWYYTSITSNDTVIVPADGVFIVNFGENIVPLGTSLRPAVLMENTLRDNLYYDIRRTYNSADVNPSYIQTSANTISYYPTINFVENLADASIVSYTFTLSATAFVKDKNNNIIDIDISELGFEISANIDYFSESLSDVSNVSLSMNEGFIIQGTSTINMTMESWIAKPDELCDPAFNEGPLYINLSIGVSPNR